jgi:hypothetical protein
MSEVRFATVPFSVTLEMDKQFSDGGIGKESIFEKPMALWYEFVRVYRHLVRHHLTVPICSLLIGFVSAYDSYLTVMYVDSLQGLELNPVGRYMMGLDDPINGYTPHIAMFLGCKFAGTVLVLFVLQILWIWRRHLSSMVAMKVAFAQTLLAFMLLFGSDKW